MEKSEEVSTEPPTRTSTVGHPCQGKTAEGNEDRGTYALCRSDKSFRNALDRLSDSSDAGRDRSGRSDGLLLLVVDRWAGKERTGNEEGSEIEEPMVGSRREGRKQGRSALLVRVRKWSTHLSYALSGALLSLSSYRYC